MADSNYIKRVAIVGAGGNSGKYMTEALLKTGKHTVTAITRVDSTSQLPEGVQVKKVNYDNHSSLVEALQGQDALVITMAPVATMAGPDQQERLIRAAADADVKWVLPNEWSPDTANEALIKDVFPFQAQGKTRALIAELGKSSYIAVSTGFWYEWSLALKPCYGFDFANRAVTLFDDGETKISTSTFSQVGRAVAALLSLPIHPEAGQDAKDQQRCLDHFKNAQVYVSSFTLSQRDMLDSVLRVTHTSPEDWTVTQEPARERYTNGIAAMQKGDRAGFARMMYARVFFDEESGNFEKTRETLNELLGLPGEDLDEATARAVKRSEEPSQWH